MKKNSLLPLDTNLNHIVALAWLEEFEGQVDVKMLSTGGHLLLLIKKDPGHMVKHYLSLSGLSGRWFGILLERLVCEGLVTRERCEKDIRGRRLR